MGILIVRNNTNMKAIDASLLLEAYLSSQSIGFATVDSYDFDGRSSLVDLGVEDPASLDLAVVLGGDGTILGTAKLVAGMRVPILGINFGRLGFLANSSEEGVIALVAAALAGDVVQERRTNLCVDVLFQGQDIDAVDFEGLTGPEAGGGSCFALNEVALTRGSTGRLIDFSLSIDGSHVTDLRGDGIVVASATGSTAYSLSAGGPLVAPGFDGMIAMPLAPHTLKSRAIVTARNDIIEIDIPEGQTNREPALFIDGEPLQFEEPVGKVVVRTGENPTILLRYKGEGFYADAARVFF